MTRRGWMALALILVVGGLEVSAQVGTPLPGWPGVSIARGSGGYLYLADGTAAQPSLTFASDTDTGIYWPAANNIGLSTGGLGAVLAVDATNVLALRNGTNAQRLNIANTWASATSNEYFSVDWQTTANVALVGTRTAATGTWRSLKVVAQGSTGSGVASLAELARFPPFIVVRPSGILNGDTLTDDDSVGDWVRFDLGRQVGTSGTANMLAIRSTYNQASGTAANTDLLIQRTETAIGSGAQYLIQAGTAATPTRFAVSNTGTTTVAGANAQALVLQQATTTVTCNSGTATCTATTLIPAGSLVVGVDARVTTILAGTGLTTWSLGDGTDTDRWGTTLALAEGTTVTLANATITTAPIYAAATNVVLTAAAGQFDSGVVRLTVHYLTVTAATS